MRNFQIKCRAESDHFPQTFELASTFEQLQISSGLIALPAMFNHKRIKRLQQGEAAVMDEVYSREGSLEVRTSLAVMQEKEPAFKSDWNENWAELIRFLLAKFTATSNLTIQPKAFITKRGRERQAWFNKALRIQKTQIVRQSRKLVNAALQGEGADKLNLWAMKKSIVLIVGPQRKDFKKTHGPSYSGQVKCQTASPFGS
ncbi:hypothetical protein NDU88_001009 [Pleurodeles waltl]|uniref:Uncharacterized protein n=1 Tax=Pleurodeles waltl TaxID=8319 RepID=A0AAV7WKX8_PLEWA|nr:hypothetical protein NDU88_001009 [Pleurodeles waltl]